MGEGQEKDQKEEQWTEVAADDALDNRDDRSTGNWVRATVLNAAAAAVSCYEVMRRQCSSGDVALDAGCPTSEAASNSRG